MSTPWGNQPSPYVASPTRDAKLSIGRVLARTLLLVVPGQLVGFALASFTIPFDALVAHPGLGWLIYVGAGVVAGLGLGLVLRPARRDLIAYAIASVVVGALVLTLFLAFAHTGMTASNARSLGSDLVRGVPLVAVLQTVLAGALWWNRLRNAAGANRSR